MPKCSKCGFRARDIAGLARHYRKKHPQSMRRKKSSKPKHSKSFKVPQGMRYCPCCGREL